MSTMTKRTCRNCTTILGQWNDGDLCWVCDRKAFDEWVKNPKPDKQPGYTREQLILKMHEWVAEHGRVPTKDDSAGLPSDSVYRRYFGTWSEAIKAAGLRGRPLGAPISESRIAVMRALENGPQPMRAIQEETGLPHDVVSKQLARMEKRGQVHKVEQIKLDRCRRVWTYALGEQE